MKHAILVNGFKSLYRCIVRKVRNKKGKKRKSEKKIMEIYKKLISEIVLKGTIEEDDLYEYLKETWKAEGESELDNSKIRRIWQVVEEDEESVWMMLALMRKHKGEREQCRM